MLLFKRKVSQSINTNDFLNQGQDLVKLFKLNVNSYKSACQINSQWRNIRLSGLNATNDLITIAAVFYKNILP